MALAACQLQMTAADQPCPHVEEVKPMIPTMKEVLGGDDKGPLAEGCLMPGKGPLVAVDVESLVVFSTRGKAAKKKKEEDSNKVEGVKA
jgi:hypothetical protein